MTNRSKTIVYLSLTIMSAVFLLPMLMMISGSLQTPEQLARNPNGFPEMPQWKNYPQAINSMPFVRYLSNTALLCIGCVVGTTLSCSLVAYGLCRIKWRGRNVVMLSVILTMLLPWQIMMVPRFILISNIGLYNSLWAIIGPTFLGDAFFIFLLRQFFISIPEELFEAGRIDGLSDWGLFWQIALPLSKPALATVALFQFIHTWNDFGGPLLYLNDPQQFPLAYGLERFVSSYGGQTHLLLAAAVIFSVPMIVMFFLAQKTFVQGIRTTGLKG